MFFFSHLAIFPVELTVNGTLDSSQAHDGPQHSVPHDEVHHPGNLKTDILSNTNK